MRLHNRVNKKELREKMLHESDPRHTISFYKYYHIGNPALFRDHLYLEWSQLEVFGRIYVAGEGINGQISVPDRNLPAFREKLNEIEFLKGIRLNFAVEDDGHSFYKLDVKVRSKIVADGLDDRTFDVTDTGTHLNAEAFNAITDLPNTIVVDMRNHYESEVGHFENAITPDVTTFRESLPIVADMLAENKDKNLVMYCTGGIRCEKASAYMKYRGFKNVFQLDGGIIQYAKEVKEKGLRNKFIGKNFVFDERLGERISNDVIARCHQCGNPCDTHVNCANEACHILFIQCDACAEKYQHCCSEKCNEFRLLPESEQQQRRPHEVFNGSRFGKGRYKAHHGEEKLAVS